MSDFNSYLWLCLAAYGIHVLEEYCFNWRDWANNVLHLPATWGHFYIVNAIVVVLGVVAPAISERWPVIALGFPFLMLINAAFFHVGPFVWKRGVFSPGLFTAVILFFPLGYLTIRSARLDAVQIAWGAVVGAILMASPIVFIKLALKPYFDQTVKS